MAGLPGVGGGLPGYARSAQSGLSAAASTFAHQRPLPQEDEKTVGGGIMSTATMAASGAMVGSLFGPGPGTAIGLGVGAAAGLGMYLFG